MHVLTLPFDSQMGRFDDGPLGQFLADKDLVKSRDHFFTDRGQHYLAVVLTYRYPENRAPVAPGRATKPRDRDSWRELLQAADFPIFNTLREWRGRRARDEGVPPYVICTNRQLAAVVRARPGSLNKLGEIDGFGKAKIHKYGEDMLALLHAPLAADAGPGDSTSTEDDSDGR